MTVFLTPNRKPFFGGTYFPARDGDRGNSMGFLTLVKRINQARGVSIFHNVIRRLDDIQEIEESERVAARVAAAIAASTALPPCLAIAVPDSPGRKITAT